MNENRAPKRPPLLHEWKFISNCLEKPRLFNDYLVNQGKLIVNASTFPNLESLTNKKLNWVTTLHDDILSLIQKLNPNKAGGPDGIYRKMLSIGDSPDIQLLRIIIQNILTASVYPGLSKLGNVTPIFKIKRKTTDW